MAEKNQYFPHLFEPLKIGSKTIKNRIEAAPALFRHAGPACCQGGCPEGKMTCGQMAAVRERFAALHAAPSTAETR